MDSNLSEHPNDLINKLLENQYYTMFKKFDTRGLDALTLPEFQKFTYAIGMDFINQLYNSGIGELFNTESNKKKSNVTFPEFMRYLSQKSTFQCSQDQYRNAMCMMD